MITRLELRALSTGITHKYEAIVTTAGRHLEEERKPLVWIFMFYLKEFPE